MQRTQTFNQSEVQNMCASAITFGIVRDKGGVCKICVSGLMGCEVVGKYCRIGHSGSGDSASARGVYGAHVAARHECWLAFVGAGFAAALPASALGKRVYVLPTDLELSLE